MDGVEGVAGAGVVHVEARVVGDQAVVAGVVDAAEGEGGTEVVALGGVVVDHIQDHLDPGGVQRLDHLLELGDLTAGMPRAGIARLRGEEVDGVVAPVVAQPLLQQVTVVEEGVHRQQLDRGDAEVLEVGDHRRRGEPGVGAAQLRGQVRMTGGEPLDVQLVDHRIVERGVGAAVVPPGKGAVDDDPLGHAPGVVLLVPHQVIAASQGIAEDRGVPIDTAGQRSRVRIDEELGRVEAMSGLRLPRTIDPIAVALAGTDARQIAVPDVGGHLAQRHALLVLPVVVEQAELDPGGVLD